MFRPAGEETDSDDSSFDATFVPVKQFEDAGVKKEEVEDMTLVADLICAVEAGDLETVGDCLTSVSVNTLLSVWSCGEVTAGGLAVLNVQDEVLKLVMERGGHCNGEGFILLASSECDCEQEKMLRCAELLTGLDSEDINRSQGQGLTPLMIACRNGNRPLVRWIVQHGAQLDLQDNILWTALMFAVDVARGDVARLLLDSGADPGLVNTEGQTAADIAAVGEQETLEDIIVSYTGEKGRQVVRETQQVRQVTELENTLDSEGLGHLAMHLTNHNIDLETFLMLREEDINNLGVEEIGDVKRLVLCQAKLHKEEWKKSSLPRLERREGSEGLMIDIVTATTMMANISQHAKYMKTNVAYIRRQLSEHGERLLNAGSDQVTGRQLVQQVEGAAAHIAHLRGEVVNLDRDLAKIDGPGGRSYLQYLGLFSLIAGSVSLFLYSRSK